VSLDERAEPHVANRNNVVADAVPGNRGDAVFFRLPDPMENRGRSAIGETVGIAVSPA